MPWISDFALQGVDSPPSRLYHYTSQSGLLGILKTRTIWSTRIQFLNDSREFVHTLDLWKRTIEGVKGAEANAQKPEVLRVLNGLHRGLDSTAKIPIHVACFSADGDSLSQWRGYSPGGNGFSIGFNCAQLMDAAERQSCFIAPCIYDPTRQQELVQKLLEICRERCETKRPEEGSERWTLDIVQDFVFLAAVLKNPSFQEEREWRIVTQAFSDGHPQIGIRQGKTMPVPYFGFELAKPDEVLDLEIVVGPSPESGMAVQSVKSLLAVHKCNGVARPSVVPYRQL